MKKEIKMSEVTAVESVDVEVVEEVQETVMTSGIAAKLMGKVTFSQIDPSLSLAERAPIVREMLQKSHEAEGRLEIIQGELLYEANRNGYWKDYQFTDDTGTTRAYATWDEFCETELNIKRRTSFTRIDTYKTFCVDLPLSPETLEEIDWSKAALITKVINPENYAAILDAISTMTWRQVKAFVSNLKTTEDVSQAASLATQPAAITMEDDESDPGAGGAASAGAAEGDVTKTFSVKMAQSQLENVEVAISECGKLIGSDSKAHCLDVICTDYLTQLDTSTGGDPSQQKLELLARIIERLQANFGVTLSVDGMEE